MAIPVNLKIQDHKLPAKTSFKMSSIDVVIDERVSQTRDHLAHGVESPPAGISPPLICSATLVALGVPT